MDTRARAVQARPAPPNAGTKHRACPAVGWADFQRVLGQHRYEVADPVVSREAGEQGDADVHHTLGLRDHDGAPPEPRQPMPLAGVVPLDAVRFLLARVQLSDRQQYIVNRVVVRTVQAGGPTPFPPQPTAPKEL